MASFPDTEWKPLYLEDENKKRARLIGIEFEAKVKPLDKMPDDKFQFLSEEWLNENSKWNADGAWLDGEEDEMYNSRAALVQGLMEEKGLVLGGVGYDGGGKEFVTMPDSYGCYLNGGSQRLKDILEVLDKYTTADAESGTHVHVSKLSSDTPKTWDNIYWFCMCFGPQLQKLFGRQTHWAAIPLPNDYFVSNNDTSMKMFEKPQKRPKTQHGYAKGTMVVNREDRYEFRGPKSTHDLNEVLAWAQLCHNIVEICANGYIKDIPFNEALRGEYIRAYAHAIEKNPNRKLSSAERGMRISDVGYVKVNLRDKRY